MQKGTKCHLEPYYTEKHKNPMIFHCNKVTSGNKSVKVFITDGENKQTDDN